MLKNESQLRVMAIAVAVGCVSSGCAASEVDEPSPVTVQGVSMTAELDESSGAVILPYDRFAVTAEEADIFTTAASFAVSACAAEQGVVFRPTGLMHDAVYDSELYFGPWTEEQAQRFGFVTPMTDADLIANEILAKDAAASVEPPANPNLELTDADWTVMDACGAAPEVAQYLDAVSSGPWEEPLRATKDSLLDEDDAQELVAQLEACLTGAGLTPLPEEPGYPRGADTRTISEDQIRMALQVVRCKDEIDFTGAMARVEARLQSPIIEKYADELVAKRHSIDELAVQARALIAATATTEQ